MLGTSWKKENQRVQNRTRQSSGTDCYVSAYEYGFIHVHVFETYHTCACINMSRSLRHVLTAGSHECNTHTHDKHNLKYIQGIPQTGFTSARWSNFEQICHYGETHGFAARSAFKIGL